VVAAATAGAPGSSTPPVVLGAETNDLSSPVTTAPAGLFANILASPTHSISFALGALAAILAVILLVTLIAHARVQYVEVVGTGLVMVSLILVVLMFNQVSGSRVVIPSGTQSAAVVNALP
jgi:predicted membrane metal-binding protein